MEDCVARQRACSASRRRCSCGPSARSRVRCRSRRSRRRGSPSFRARRWIVVPPSRPICRGTAWSQGIEERKLEAGGLNHVRSRWVHVVWAARAKAVSTASIACQAAESARHSPGRMRPRSLKRLEPSGRKTSVSPSSSVRPVASDTTTPCVTRTLIVPGAGFIPSSRRAARICARQRASCAAVMVFRRAGVTVAGPKARRAVSRVRQNALVRTAETLRSRRRTPLPIARASARPCWERFRCVAQSVRSTGSSSGFEKSVAACLRTSTRPPA